MSNVVSETAVTSTTVRQDAQQMRKLVVASVLGNALEWYDFFLYGTAAALVFGPLFFPVGGDPLQGTLLAFSGFAVGFLARPLGGILFGHIGDRYSRKMTLIMTLTLMGATTFVIGLLPTYAQIGIWAPLSLIILRFLQGVASGGEWGGGVLMLSENAPASRRGFYTAWSQMGVSGGFVLSAFAFYLVQQLPENDFLGWGWRVPFIFSAVLVIIGLYVRVSLHETPVFAKVAAAKKQVKVPMGTLLSKHVRVTVLGTFIMLATYTLFYIMTVYSMTYSTAAVPHGLGLPRNEVLWMLMLAVIGFGVMVPIAGLLADRFGRRPSMIVITSLIIIFALFFFQPLLGSGNPALIMLYLLVGLSLMGLTFGPMGALLPELFPTEVRYTGASFSYNVSSILGASVAPYIAAWLQSNYGLAAVGIYLACMAALTLIALLLTHETRHQSL